jgi:hypothetical protein
MKTSIVTRGSIAAVALSSLWSCSIAPKSNESIGRVNQSVSQPNVGQDTLKQSRALADGAVKLNNELGVQIHAIQPLAFFNGHPNPELAKQSGSVMDPQMMGALANLAKIYNERGEKSPLRVTIGQPQSAQQKLAYLQQFIVDQSSTTMAFAYQLQGKYKAAADILAQRIAYLESSNGDRSKDHTLAVTYNQYAECLNHLGRGAEGEQMKLRARAIEPNHY